MKLFVFFPLAFLITACSSQQVDPYSRLSDAELQAELEQAQKERPVQYCKKVLPVAQIMSQRETSNRKKLAVASYAEVRCAIEEGRLNDAYVSMVLFEQRVGALTGLMGFNLAYFAEHYVDAVARLEAMASDPQSSDLQYLESERFWNLFRQLSSEN